MFSYWLCAFYVSGSDFELDLKAESLNKKMYSGIQTKWSGTLTHSSLTEQLGTEEFGGVRQARFQEHMSALRDEHGDEIPDDMIEAAWRRSRYDSVRSASQAGVEKAKDKARKAERKEKQTAQSKAEEAAYEATYAANRKSQMTQKGLADFCARLGSAGIV